MAANCVQRYPTRIAGFGAIAAIACGSLYFMNETQYQYTDNLPERNPASIAINKIDDKLTGTDTLTVLLEWPKGQAPSHEEMISAIDQAHAILESEPKLGQVSSMHNVKEWYERGSENADMFAFLENANAT